MAVRGHENIPKYVYWLHAKQPKHKPARKGGQRTYKDSKTANLAIKRLASMVLPMENVNKPELMGMHQLIAQD